MKIISTEKRENSIVATIKLSKEDWFELGKQAGWGNAVLENVKNDIGGAWENVRNDLGDAWRGRPRGAKGWGKAVLDQIPNSPDDDLLRVKPYSDEENKRAYDGNDPDSFGDPDKKVDIHDKFEVVGGSFKGKKGVVVDLVDSFKVKVNLENTEEDKREQVIEKRYLKIVK